MLEDVRAHHQSNTNSILIRFFLFFDVVSVFHFNEMEAVS